MYRYWDIIVEPIIKLIRPETIMEIGAEKGNTTEKLIAYCRTNHATLYSIDPFPKFDVEKWQRDNREHFKFYRALSLSAIPLIETSDLVFIDGDHNWYTVYNELKLLEKQCKKKNTSFPLVFLHDIGWPYGRRDLYYEPDNIPEIFRKPYKQKGIVPGSLDLVDDGGLNADLYNSVYENDSRNGVLTAVEDFLEQTGIDLEIITIPGLYGLGILTPASLRKKNDKLDLFLNKIEIDPAVKLLIEKIEMDRIQKQMAVNRRDAELDKVKLKLETILKNHKLELQKQQFRFQEQENKFQEQESKFQEQESKFQDQESKFQDQESKFQEQESRQQKLTASVDIYETELRQTSDDIRLLRRFFEKAESDFFAMLGSNRWRMGNAMGELLRKIMFKKKVPMVSESIEQTLHQYNNWKESESQRPGKKKTSLLIEDAPGNTNFSLNYDLLHSCCKKILPLPRVDDILHVLQKNTISIVVPVYNAFDETRQCIKSILEHTTIPFELIIIDDCSPDDRISRLLNQFGSKPFIHVYRNESNLGFVKSVNLGMEKAAGDVVLLNSDTKVTSRWLQKLVIAAYSDPITASVTPFSNASGAFSVPEIGENREISPHLTLQGMAHIVERVSEMEYPDVPTGNGFCMFIKRQVIDDIGLFDHEHFNRGYGEENDFCMRAIKKGWRHIIDDSTFIYHKNSASFSFEKEKLIKENRKILDQLHPEYTKLVGDFVSSPVLKDIRARIKTEIEKPAGKKRADALRILYVMHEGTGGTPATNQDLMKNISKEYECFLLTSDSKNLILRYVEDEVITEIYKYKLKDSWSAKNFRPEEFRKMYFSILVNLKIEMVHIRHLFKHSFELPEICRSLGLGVVYSFHDFYHVCPSIHLLDGNNKYCDGKCSGTGQCRVPTELLSDLPVLREWLPIWREQVEKIIKNCNVVVTTSDFTKRVYTDAYPSLREKRFAIIEHGRDFPVNLPGCSELPDTKSKIKILVPGNIEDHKGSHFIKSLYELDTENRIEFHFLGAISGELKDCGVYHGPYNRDNFYDKVNKIRPSFAGIFSIWPETYCHTLTESWACGIPVLAFNIGTIGERVRRHKGGWFLDMENAGLSYEKIFEIVGNTAEYESCRNTVNNIVFKTTEEMAEEYLKEYSHARKDIGTQKEKNPTVVLFTPQGLNGYPGSSYVRTLLPLNHPEFLNAFNLKLISNKDTARQELENQVADGNIPCVLIQRDALIQDDLDRILSVCAVHKIPVVYEIDDNLAGIDKSHPDFRSYKNKIKAVEKLCCSSNLIIVSTPELKEGLLKYSSEIRVIKNALDENLWFSPLFSKPNQHKNNQINIGYMGTFTHEGDLALLKEVIPEVKKSLADIHGISMEFYMVGGQKDTLIESNWFKRIQIPDENKVYPRFVKWLRENIDWDIAVAPLEDNLLNRSKSELKFLEYTALGAAGVYSARGGYINSVTHRKNGFLVQGDSREKWKEYLIELALDKKLRMEIVKQARDTVETNYLLKQRVEEWKEAFSAI